MLPEYLAPEYPRWGEYDDASREDIEWLYDEHLEELTRALDQVVEDLRREGQIANDTQKWVEALLEEA